MSDEVKAACMVSQADLVRYKLLQIKALQLQKQLRTIKIEMARSTQSISEALLIGADIEEGPHVAYLEQKMKLEVL